MQLRYGEKPVAADTFSTTAFASDNSRYWTAKDVQTHSSNSKQTRSWLKVTATDAEAKLNKWTQHFSLLARTFIEQQDTNCCLNWRN
jgi:phosphoribosylaminoimidazole-succinocarboxamide synthase